MTNLPAKVGSTDLEIVDAEIVDDYPEAEVRDTQPQDTAKANLLGLLESRRMLSLELGQIDNSKLYAGSNMYYYCKFCGIQTDVLSEGWFISQPSTVCSECKVLVDFGWHDGILPSFPYKNQSGGIPELGARELNPVKKKLRRNIWVHNTLTHRNAKVVKIIDLTKSGYPYRQIVVQPEASVHPSIENDQIQWSEQFVEIGKYPL